jgi:hypothetical protein
MGRKPEGSTFSHTRGSSMEGTDSMRIVTQSDHHVECHKLRLSPQSQTTGHLRRACGSAGKIQDCDDEG